MLLSITGTPRKCKSEWELVRRGESQNRKKKKVFLVRDVEEQCGPEKRKRGTTKEMPGKRIKWDRG